MAQVHVFIVIVWSVQALLLPGVCSAHSRLSTLRRVPRSGDGW